MQLLITIFGYCTQPFCDFNYILIYCAAPLTLFFSLDYQIKKGDGVG